MIKVMYCNLGLDLYLNKYRVYSVLSFWETTVVGLSKSLWNIHVITYIISDFPITHFPLHFMVFADIFFLCIERILLSHLYKSSVEKCLYLSGWTNVLHPIHRHDSTSWLLIHSLCLHIWFFKALNYMIGCCKYYTTFYRESIESFGRIEEIFNYT